MTTLVVRDAARPAEIRLHTTDRPAIARAFADLGAFYDHWEVAADLPAEAPPSIALELYGDRIGGLQLVGGYQGADVVRLRPDHPERVAMRAAFLKEHTHDDDEVRFFAEGSGVFYLHVDDAVIQIDCERGDLLLVPKGVKHWFDAGVAPNFTAVRLFTAAPRWEALYTGDDIALTVEAAVAG